MKPEDLLALIGETRAEMVADAEQETRRGPRQWIRRSAVLAACLLLVVGIAALRLSLARPEAEAPAADGGGVGHAAGSVFMSYAGPILPLSLLDRNDDLAAARSLTMDFSDVGVSAEAEEVWGNNGNGIQVLDTYTLTNSSARAQTVTAVYPFSGNLQMTQWPNVSVNGTVVDWELRIGGYSGGFRGAGDTQSSSLNLDRIVSWEGYECLLRDGSYAAEAFTEPELPAQPAIVYVLSELSDGGSGLSAATMCMTIDYDREKTAILTRGFNGAGIQEGTGAEYRCCFIRDGLRSADLEKQYLIVLGEDLQDWSLQGYKDGGCQPGEELESASGVVTRIETTLAEVLEEISRDRFDAISGNSFDGDRNRYLHNSISFDQYFGAILRFFNAYGPGGTDPKQRYADGRLDELLTEAAFLDRILYLTFELTIPAGDEIQVQIHQYKAASFDFHCSGSENIGVEGYDLVPTLGSNLTFTEQTASLSNHGQIEIVRQNFGFDPAAGTTTVLLDPAIPHYWLEVRKKISS